MERELTAHIANLDAIRSTLFDSGHGQGFRGVEFAVIGLAPNRVRPFEMNYGVDHALQS